MRTLHALILTAPFALLACRPAPQPEPPSSSAYGVSQEVAQTDAAVARGEVSRWVAAPTYFKDHALYGIWRGPRPGAGTKSQSTLGSTSKIAWSRSGYAHETTLLNMILVTPEGEAPLYSPTPYAIVEMALLSPAPTQVAAPTLTPPEGADVEVPDGVHVHVDVHAGAHAPGGLAADPNAARAQTMREGAPRFVRREERGRVASREAYWELARLERELALACVALRVELPPKPGQEQEQEGPRWSTRGEIWIRALDGSATLTHRDDQLEPSSWQLHPGPTPQLEVVMQDAQGWPRRVDLIDLNTLEVRTLNTLPAQATSAEPQ